MLLPILTAMIGHATLADWVFNGTLGVLFCGCLWTLVRPPYEGGR